MIMRHPSLGCEAERDRETERHREREGGGRGREREKDKHRQRQRARTSGAQRGGFEGRRRSESGPLARNLRRRLTRAHSSPFISVLLYKSPSLFSPPLFFRRCRVEGEHPTGACVDVGGEGQWDRLFVGWPVVVNHKELEFRMYYHSLDPDTKKFTVGE